MVFLLLVFLLIAATPVNVMEGTVSTQAVIHNAPSIDFKLICIGEDKNPHYRFIGTLILCDEILGVQALAVYSSFDSTNVKATPYTHELKAIDTCIVETFVFGIHGGMLRKQLEKPGLCTIIIFGISCAFVFEMTDSGKAELLQVILKPKRRII